MDSISSMIIAMTVRHKNRIYAISMLAIFLALIVYIVTDMTKAVYIRDGEELKMTYTFKSDAKDILEDEGIKVMAFDVVSFSGFEGKLGEISITRAFPVRISADGLTQTLMMTEGKVADALELAQLELGEDDTINLPLAKTVEENDSIIIERIQYLYTEVEEVIPFETERKISPLLQNGKKKVLEEGVAGLQRLYYKQKIVDGEPQEAQLYDTKTVKQPSVQVLLVGGKEFISPFDFNVELNEKNQPLSYKQVFTNQSATGYSARRGALTASGRKAIVGHVAVNPNKIPYGSKLFITNASGTFVYGYAVAADTGIALMDGRCDVDLFYDTYEESCLNGRRNVNIYVLE